MLLNYVKDVNSMLSQAQILQNKVQNKEITEDISH